MAVLLIALTSVPCAAEGRAAPRRWAVVVGENRGMPGDEPLRFAGDDARRVRDALVEVGGARPEDVILLEHARADALRTALTQTRTTLASSAGPGDSLVVYVSSHADEQALHLDGTTLPLAEVVDFVKAAPVDIAVLVIDSCHSGAVTRTKGLRVLEGPPVRLDASGVQGRVFISASGVDEYAQESDALGGSTFTHHFLTGLRGAADVSRDGQVTVDELYAWAWARTLEATFASRAGVQRPSFRVDLHGQGQLVLATPGAAPGRLRLDVAAPGHWLIVDGASGAVVADLDKPQGTLLLGVAPGTYRVTLRGAEGVLARVVTVPERGVASLAGEDLERASLTRVALKGGPVAEWHLALGAGVATGLLRGLGAEPGGELGLRRADTAASFFDVAALGLAFRTARSTGTGFRQDEFELHASLGHRVQLSRLTLSAEAGPGALLVAQSELPGGDRRTGLEGLVQAALDARLFVVRPVGLFATARAGLGLIKKEAGLELVPRLGGVAGLFVAF